MPIQREGAAALKLSRRTMVEHWEVLMVSLKRIPLAFA